MSAYSYSYTLVALFVIYLIYIVSKYASIYNLNMGSFNSNATQINGTIFVAIIQRQNSPPTNIKAARETWLQRVDSHVFSEKEGTWRDRSKIRFPPSIHGYTSQIRWIAAYVNEILKSQANWFVITQDTSYLVMENLVPLLPEIETPAYSYVADTENKTFYLLVLNRPAMKFLSKVYSLNICASATVQTCLRLGNGKVFNIDHDENGLKRYHVQQRHMNMKELKINTKNGQYSDGASEYKALSKDVHSFHNLLAKEIIWYNTMVYGMSRSN